MFSGVLNSFVSCIMAFRSVRNAKGIIEDFEWLLLNSSGEDLLRLRFTSLQGKRASESLHVLLFTHKLFEKLVKVVETGNSLLFEQEYNGNWYAMVAVKMGDGLTILLTDISEKKKAEAKIRAALN